MKFFCKKNIITLLIIFACCSSVFADNEVIESLKQELEEPNSPENQIDILNQLSYEYYQIDIEKTFLYGNQALNEAKGIDYQKGIAKALKYLAIGHSVQKNIPKSIELDEAALQIARQIADVPLIAQTLNSLGLNYERIGLNEKAISCYLESLEYSAQCQDDRMRCFTYRNLGFLHDKLGNSEKAIAFFKMGGEVAEQSDHHMIRYIADLTKGNYHKRLGQFELALEYFKKAYPQCTNQFSRATVLTEISSTYEQQEKWKEALDFLNKAIVIIKDSGNDDFLEDTQLKMASLLFKKKDYDQCLRLLKTILGDDKAERKYSFNSKRLHQLLAETYQELNDDKKAAFYFQKVNEIQDSIYNRNQLDLIAGLEAKFQVDEKEKENQSLRAQQERNAIILEQRKTTIIYSIIVSILISIVALLLFNAYRNKKQFNKALQEQVQSQTKALRIANNSLKDSNIELERFAYVASHDLKEPLRNISSFSGLLEHRLKDKKEKPQIMEYLHYIKSNAQQMNSLIKDILEYSKVDNDKKNRFEEVNFNIIIEEVKNSIFTDIQKHNVSINVQAKPPNIYTISSQFFLVFKNLISNGIKYNDSETKIIDIGYEEKESFHQFSVKDNGIGIEASYQDQIFELFKRLHNREQYQGSGLGLAICKKIIKNLDGEIWVESSQKGSTFFFTIAKISPNE